jgi:hypothetical protein
LPPALIKELEYLCEKSTNNNNLNGNNNNLNNNMKSSKELQMNKNYILPINLKEELIGTQ